MSLRRQPSSIRETVKDQFRKMGMASCVSLSAFDGAEASATDASSTSSASSSTLSLRSVDDKTSSFTNLSLTATNPPTVPTQRPSSIGGGWNHPASVGNYIMDRQYLIKTVEDGRLSPPAISFPQSGRLDQSDSAGLAPPPWHSRSRTKSACTSNSTPSRSSSFNRKRANSNVGFDHSDHSNWDDSEKRASRVTAPDSQFF